MSPKMIPIENRSITIPDDLRKHYGIEDSSLLVIEAGVQGIVLRPADWPEIEEYTPDRIAESLLNNAVDDEDYKGAVVEVRKLGVDPVTVPHDRSFS